MLVEGQRLFSAIFEATAESWLLWHAIDTRLHEARIDCLLQPRPFASTLWELITPTNTGMPLCPGVGSFVRIARALATEFAYGKFAAFC
jgi:hypothetical protein